jgi:hypothetical protein
MKTSNIAMLSVPMLVAGSIALSGCGQRSAKNPTMIAYSQLGICKSYATPTGDEEKAKPNEGFAVFKIEYVDNSKQSDAFNLDPERFFVNQTPPAMEQKNISFRSRRFMNRDPRFAQSMGVQGLERAVFAAKQKTDVNSFIVVPLHIDTALGGAEASQYAYDLTYDTTTSEQQTGANDVVATKTNPADTKYSLVENCKELAFK